MLWALVLYSWVYVSTLASNLMVDGKGPTKSSCPEVPVFFSFISVT